MPLSGVFNANLPRFLSAEWKRMVMIMPRSWNELMAFLLALGSVVGWLICWWQG
ncbi:hypothetical protein O3W44_07950 [Pantoea sp. LMR881]|uniref:hypothetical protein n=1 Tax=Pantoea sp. LMR881 TaxID=3014336 RepID=UPI0022B07EEA|nr:hypothetical protein [Pantoea sp. LMR881]MCZ4059020.1 hypothetical protein [Pantoea sp. LMR881]